MGKVINSLLVLCYTLKKPYFGKKKADLYTFLSFIWEEVPWTSRVIEVTQKYNFICRFYEIFCLVSKTKSFVVFLAYKPS